MKKLLILSCALAFCLALAACHTTDSADSSVSSGSPSSAIANESTAHQTEPESSLEESQTSQDTTVTSDPTESETTAPAKPADPMSTTKPESEKATESTTPPQTEPETKPAEPSSEPENSCAGVEDARAVADKVLEYINSFRIEKAKEIMSMHPNTRLSDVAKLVGYADQNYFSSNFSKLTGRSPSEYRLSILENGLCGQNGGAVRFALE